jgi:NADH-quinone oxidoreductase subunit H
MSASSTSSPISSLGVYGVIMGGWASNSKYPFLGALRSAAQMVSYEVSIGFVIITVLLCVGSLNLSTSSTPGPASARLGLPHVFLRLALAAAVPDVRHLLHLGPAETNRPPFDLPEAESELVAGFHGGVSAPRRTCCSCWANTSPSS